MRLISIFLYFLHPHWEIKSMWTFHFLWIEWMEYVYWNLIPQNSLYWKTRILCIPNKNSLVWKSLHFYKQVINDLCFKIFFSLILRFLKKCWHLTIKSTTNLYCLVKWKPNILKGKRALKWKTTNEQVWFTNWNMLSEILQVAKFTLLNFPRKLCENSL